MDTATRHHISIESIHLYEGEKKVDAARPGLEEQHEEATKPQKISPHTPIAQKSGPRQTSSAAELGRTKLPAVEAEPSVEFMALRS